MPNNSKGQYLSLEQMVLFSISVIITVSIYFSFTAASDRVGEETIKDQLEEIGELTTSGISQIYTGRNVKYAERELQIPKKISGKSYKIITTGSTVQVIRGKRAVEVDIGEISDTIQITQSGDHVTGVSSSKGELLIKLENGKIKLGR